MLSAVSWILRHLKSSLLWCYLFVCCYSFWYSSNFLVAKTKVNPSKKLSMTCLDFLVCVLLGKFLGWVKSAFQGRIFINECFCWTNSEAALCWIKDKGMCWQSLVNNKVGNIRKVADQEGWFYVSGVLILSIFQPGFVVEAALINGLMCQAFCIATNLKKVYKFDVSWGCLKKLFIVS